MLQKIIEKIATSSIVKYARKIKIVNIILTRLWTWRLHSRYGKIDVAEVKDNIANIFWANDWFQHNLKYALNSTLKSIEALPKQLFDVGGGGDIKHFISHTSLEKKYPILRQESKALLHLFEEYKTDKHHHEYQYVYAYIFNILKKRNDIKKVLEIGIGSRDPKVDGSMAWNDWSLVGGSLRVWRHYLPKAMIYGADIDKKCLFQEDRIKTYFIDQLTPKTFDNVLSKTGGDFDVIIDDGLHHLTANLNSLLFALRTLRKNGVLIIEEIDFAYDRQNGDIYRLWQTIGRLLPKDYHYEIIKCNVMHVFIIQKQ